MRSLTLGLLAAIALLFTLPSASAQGVIELGPSIAGVMFSEEGGGNLLLNLCAKDVHGECVGDQVEGHTWASGTFGQDNGFYTLQGTTATTATFTGCVGTTCSWTLSTPPPGLSFEFNSKPNGGGVNLLSATVQFTGLTETPNGKDFIVVATGQLSDLGGLLAGYFGNDVLRFVFRTDKGLFKGHHQLFVRLATGWLTACSEQTRKAVTSIRTDIGTSIRHPIWQPQ
jgi:hypothetical protein